MAELAQLPQQDRFMLRGASCLDFGLGLPSMPCRCAGEWALWLGPDEWLLLAEQGCGGDLLARIDRAAEGRPYALVDVSHRQLGLMLSGEGAADILSGAVPLNLAEAAFPAGMCTRTLCEKAEIVLWRHSAYRWRLEVQRSFAPYIWALLGAIAAADGIAFSG